MKDNNSLRDGYATTKINIPGIKLDYKINTVLLDTVYCSSMGDSLRYCYKYSESGEEVTEICEIFSEKKWTNFFKYQILSDENNKTQTLYTWNKDIWMPSNYSHFKMSYSGDILTEESSFFVWSNGVWVITNKFIMQYLYGKCISRITEIYDEINPIFNIWETYSYNELSEIESSKRRYFNYNEWINIDTTNWNYLSKEYYYKIWRNNAWKDSIRGFHYQNQLGIDTLVQFEAFEKGEWKNSSLFRYRFDEKLNMTAWGIYKWENNSWLPKNALLWVYDSNNLIVTETYQKGNFNEWMNVYRKSYSYTYADVIDSEIVEYWEYDSWNSNRKSHSFLDDNQNILEYESNYWNNDWIPYDQGVNLIDKYGNNFYYYASKLKFSYSAITNNVNNLRNNPSGIAINSIYPNPSSGNFFADFSVSEAGHIKYEIINLSGKVVKTSDIGFFIKGNYQMQILMNGALESGVYIIRIIYSNGFAQKKFIVFRN
jgi:hypothetical protein